MTRGPENGKGLELRHVLHIAQLIAIVVSLSVIVFRAGKIEERLTTAIEKLESTSQDIRSNESRLGDHSTRLGITEQKLIDHDRRITKLENSDG